VTVALVGVAIYFSVLILRDFLRYARFRRLRDSAIVTWPSPRPSRFPWHLALGGLAAFAAALNGFLPQQHEFHKIYSQLAIAFYFIAVTPLLARIPQGFYSEGIWAEHGFLPYSRIRRLAFHEGSEVVLLLMPQEGGAFRLRVPPQEYGAVRRVLGDMIRSRSLNLEGSLLGL
jgi:hypothetical protein